MFKSFLFSAVGLPIRFRFVLSHKICLHFSIALSQKDSTSTALRYSPVHVLYSVIIFLSFCALFYVRKQGTFLYIVLSSLSAVSVRTKSNTFCIGINLQIWELVNSFLCTPYWKSMGDFSHIRFIYFLSAHPTAAVSSAGLRRVKKPGGRCG